MRRFCLLLLAFLFPLQLFAAVLEPMAHQLAEPSVMVAADGGTGTGTGTGSIGQPASFADTDDAAVADADGAAEDGQLKVQSDLEDQTLPAAPATLPLHWHPFPHRHPYVNRATAAFISLLRPPPLL